MGWILQTAGCLLRTDGTGPGTARTNAAGPAGMYSTCPETLISYLHVNQTCPLLHRFFIHWNIFLCFRLSERFNVVFTSVLRPGLTLPSPCAPEKTTKFLLCLFSSLCPAAAWLFLLDLQTLNSNQTLPSPSTASSLFFLTLMWLMARETQGNPANFLIRACTSCFAFRCF